MVRVDTDKKQSFETKRVENSLDPVWNEDCELTVTDPATQSIQVKVYDHNSIGTHKRMGYTSVPISTLQPNVPQDVWLPLLEAPTGSIRLVMTFKPFATGSSYVRACAITALCMWR